MGKKKNILVVLARIDSGGNFTSVYNLIHYLGDEYNFHLLCINDSKNKLPEKCNFYQLNYGHEISLIGNIKKAFGIYRSISAVIREQKIDILFEILPCDNIFSVVRFPGVRRIFSFRDFVQMKENMDRHHRITRKSDLVIFNSASSMEYYLEQYGNDFSRVRTINNYINFERIDSLKNRELSLEYIQKVNGRFVFSTIGRLTPVKGQNKLIRAFEYMMNTYKVDAVLVIIGGGSLQNDLEKMIALSTHKNNFILLGNCNNPYNYLKNSDAYVCSSHSEGFPNAILEALACELPVISTNCMTGPAEILSENCKVDFDDIYEAEYGILIPPLSESDTFDLLNISDDEKRLAEAMYKLYSDERIRIKYKEVALKRAKDYNPMSISQKWRDAFDYE